MTSPAPVAKHCTKVHQLPETILFCLSQASPVMNLVDLFEKNNHLQKERLKYNYVFSF